MTEEVFIKYGNLIKQALLLMPLECPGAEEDYPPSDSIEAHRLIVEAKNLILPLAEDGDVQAMSLLGNLYHSLADKLDIKQAYYWTKKAALAGDEYSLSVVLDMEKEYNDYMDRN